MLNSAGRKAKTLDDAKSFIRIFVDQISHLTEEQAYSKTFDFDLYLPMMMDWVLNVPGEKDEEYTPTHELEVLYMDAAWELCQQGLMRPGPKATNSENPGDAYGKGFCLTAKGREWMAEARPPTSAEHDAT